MGADLRQFVHEHQHPIKINAQVLPNSPREKNGVKHTVKNYIIQVRCVTRDLEFWQP